MNHIEEQVQRLLQPLVETMGYEFAGCEFHPYGKGRSMLQIYIAKSTGNISSDDCSKVSRQISAVLDVEDIIKVPYLLEVSSPGIERPLFTLQQFRQFIGRQAKISLREPIKMRRNFSGEIINVTDDAVILKVDHELTTLPFNTIMKANLTIENDDLFKRKDHG